MTTGRRRSALIALLATILIAAGAVAFVGRQNDSVEAKAERPTLMLLTTLPLIFGESFSLEGGGSAALEALEQRYQVVPISVTATSELKQGAILLMAHPLAQPADALVDLDQWVRSGGKLLLLADPALDWHSDRPLGDRLRPLPAFADTGLLGHWGLRLDAPDERGPRALMIRDREVLTASPGQLFGEGCSISKQRLVADCRIGKGHVTVIADADFLNVGGGGGALDGPTDGNLDSLVEELARLERL